MRLIGTIPRGAAIGLGVFDGVHLGHREIVQKSDAILTFHPHPDRVLNKNSQLEYLTSLREMRALLQTLAVFRFTTRASKLPHGTFLEYIAHDICPSKIIVGDDFRFGYNQLGTSDFLSEWAKTKGIGVEVVGLRGDGNQVIKSTVIRTWISSGDVDRACQWLGHPYPLFGTVIRGKGTGKTLGFPTANLVLSRHKCVPGFGVYNAVAQWGEKRVSGIVYIGRRPTLGYGFAVELHIPGFSGDLYGRRLQVWINRRIRGEMKFENVADLVDQITRDIRELSPF